MARSSLVYEHDVRSLLAIVNGLGELPDDPALRCSHLMTEICRFFGARSGMVALLNGKPKDDESIVKYAGAGGFLDESTTRLYQRYSSEAHLRDPMLTRIMERGGPVGVFVRRDEVSDHEWYNSVHYNEMRIPLGINDALYTFWPIPNAPLLAGVGFNRELHGKLFSKRERSLAAILHEALVPFYRYLYQSCRGAAHPPLTPRASQVYHELLRGLSEKEVALRLGISRHSVHDHVKVIYATFGVNSRAELLSRARR